MKPYFESFFIRPLTATPVPFQTDAFREKCGPLRYGVVNTLWGDTEHIGQVAHKEHGFARLRFKALLEGGEKRLLHA